jgi:hypothetical protein
MGQRRTGRLSVHLGLWKAHREERGVRNGVDNFYARRLSLPCGGERRGSGEQRVAKEGVDILIGNEVKF